jgi:hypothetical protein
LVSSERGRIGRRETKQRDQAMSIFSISDVTPAGAFCNAMDAARENDRRAARHRPRTRTEAAKTESPAAILTVLRSALRRIAGLPGYSGPRHTAAASR